MARPCCCRSTSRHRRSDASPPTASASATISCAEARFGRDASAEPAPIEGDQPLPMPLRRRLVVDLALRKGKAVMYPGIDLEFTGTTGLRKQAFEFGHHRQRRQVVNLRAGDVELTLDLGER